MIQDQEMIFGSINYWEGPLDVKASINGEQVSGSGFMELVGYPSDYSALALTGREMAGRINEVIRMSKEMIIKRIGF